MAITVMMWRTHVLYCVSVRRSRIGRARDVPIIEAIIAATAITGSSPADWSPVYTGSPAPVPLIQAAPQSRWLMIGAAAILALALLAFLAFRSR